jgi:hypothetical protein
VREVSGPPGRAKKEARECWVAWASYTRVSSVADASLLGSKARGVAQVTREDEVCSCASPATARSIPVLRYFDLRLRSAAWVAPTEAEAQAACERDAQRRCRREGVRRLLGLWTSGSRPRDGVVGGGGRARRGVRWAVSRPALPHARARQRVVDRWA